MISLDNARAIWGSWSCQSSIAPGIHRFVTTYRRDGSGLRSFDGVSTRFHYFVTGGYIIITMPGPVTTREAYSVRHGHMAKGPASYWHEGSWNAQPDAGVDVCLRSPASYENVSPDFASSRRR